METKPRTGLGMNTGIRIFENILFRERKVWNWGLIST
jgi:hypothetical protein